MVAVTTTAIFPYAIRVSRVLYAFYNLYFYDIYIDIVILTRTLTLTIRVGNE